MPNDFIVKSGSSVTIEDSMPQEFPVQPQRFVIEKLEDLVSAEVVKSSESLDRLLDAAKAATDERLRDRSTYVPFVPVPGTSRPDLRRFGSFVSRVPEVSSNETRSFWNIARGIDPVSLARTTVSSRLVDVTPNWRRWELLKYLFEDITIEAGAKLIVSEKVHQIECRNLLIERTGLIRVKFGASLVIRAHSIRGEQ